MNEKDKIREMVMALARSKSDPAYLDQARQAGAEVVAAKTERIAESMVAGEEATVDADDQTDDVVEEGEASEDDEESDSIGEGTHNPAKRHMRAGHRDLNAKKRAAEKPVRDRMADTSAE